MQKNRNKGTPNPAKAAAKGKSGKASSKVEAQSDSNPDRRSGKVRKTLVNAKQPGSKPAR